MASHIGFSIEQFFTYQFECLTDLFVCPAIFLPYTQLLRTQQQK